MIVKLEPRPQACRANVPAGVNLRGCHVLVVGLGRFGGGVGVTRWLATQGAKVTVTDQADAASLADSIDEIAGLGVRLRLGGHDVHDLADADLVVVNPAVVKTRSDFFGEIVSRDLPWTTEMNLFCERCPAPVVGVTGTFGKSTTSAMIAAALEGCRAAGAAPFTRVHLGGNIGVSLLPDLDEIQASDVVVLEMSNAQLEDLPRIDWGPQGAVLTNLVPHHLDRYDGSFTAYMDAKLNLLRRPDRTKWFVCGPVHPLTKARIASLPPIGGGALEVRPGTPRVELRISGEHNQANADCALTVCRAMALPEAPARLALAEFRGLSHRLEYVRTLDAVDYYNDSKSTAPAATVVALRSFSRPVVCIVGGQKKSAAELGECANLLAERCRAVICIGEAGPAFAATLRNNRPGTQPGGLTICEAASLSDGIIEARRRAEPGDVVLLSPGAPSFDAYKNYVQRGQHFVSLVNAL